MKKLHVQERAVEEVKLAIKPFYQKREVTKDEENHSNNRQLQCSKFYFKSPRYYLIDNI